MESRGIMSYPDKYGRVINGCLGTIVYTPPLWKMCLNWIKWKFNCIKFKIQWKLGIYRFRKISIPVVQKPFPVISAEDIVGVQPMSKIDQP